MNVCQFFLSLRAILRPPAPAGACSVLTADLSLRTIFRPPAPSPPPPTTQSLLWIFPHQPRRIPDNRRPSSGPAGTIDGSHGWSDAAAGGRRGTRGLSATFFNPAPAGADESRKTMKNPRRLRVPSKRQGPSFAGFTRKTSQTGPRPVRCTHKPHGPQKKIKPVADAATSDRREPAIRCWPVRARFRRCGRSETRHG